VKIWNDLSGFNASKPVVTIGIFDGVHQGHRFLLEHLKQTAKSISGETVIVSLWPHPRIVLKKDPDNLRFLTSLEEKSILMDEAGIDNFVVIPFTPEFAQMDSCLFVKEFLVDKIGIKHLVVGYNHKFGKNREGDFENLKYCASLYGFSIERIENTIKATGHLGMQEIHPFLATCYDATVKRGYEDITLDFSSVNSAFPGFMLSVCSKALDLRVKTIETKMILLL